MAAALLLWSTRAHKPNCAPAPRFIEPTKSTSPPANPSINYKSRRINTTLSESHSLPLDVEARWSCCTTGVHLKWTRSAGKSLTVLKLTISSAMMKKTKKSLVNQRRWPRGALLKNNKTHAAQPNLHRIACTMYSVQHVCLVSLFPRYGAHERTGDDAACAYLGVLTIRTW